jgi:hypothetical protein
MEQQVEATVPDVVPPPTDQMPDATWPTEILLNFAMKALGEGDRRDRRLHVLARKSVILKFRAGHAFSIIQARLTSTGDWCKFQKKHVLARTNVWEAIKVYQKATGLGHGEEEVASHGTWTELMIAYGIIKPRLAQPKEPGITMRDSAGDNDDEATGEADGVLNDDDASEEDENEDDESDEDYETPIGDIDAWPETTEDEASTPVTDEQIVAANAYVSAVGGLTHAARILVMQGAKGGDKEPVKGIMRAAVVAARSVLGWAEINEVLRAAELRANGVEVQEV